MNVGVETYQYLAYILELCIHEIYIQRKSVPMNVTYMMHQCLRLERMTLEALVVTKKAVIVYVSQLQMLMELVTGFRMRAIICTKSFRRKRVSLVLKCIGFLIQK